MASVTVPGGTVLRARQLARRALSVARSFVPLQGSYTSVLITDGTNLAAMPVSRATALAVGAVYRALAIYADLIGTMPVHRYRGDVQLPPPAFVDHPAGVPIGWTDEIGQVIWSLLLRGNAYLVVTSVDQTTGYPTTFYVADPDTVTVHRVADGIEYRVSFGSGYVNDAVYLNPSPDELLHVRWQTPPGSLLGIGILDAAGGPTGVLSGAFYADRYASDVMANPVPPVALEHPQRLDTEQANELQTQWLGSLARVRAVPAVLSGGVKITPIAVTPRDVQLIESRQYNATAIATLFGLPPHYVGGRSGDSLTYSTVEGENTRLWTDALQPMAIRLERNIGGAWTPNGQRLRFVPDAILRSQTLDRFNAHKIALDAGFETLDEVRALENLPPLDEEPAPAPPALPPAPPALPAPGGAP